MLQKLSDLSLLVLFLLAFVLQILLLVKRLPLVRFKSLFGSRPKCLRNLVVLIRLVLLLKLVEFSFFEHLFAKGVVVLRRPDVFPAIHLCLFLKLGLIGSLFWFGLADGKEV